jgi:phosphopantothenoylcysteine decarboxylase/phosphopantothenate--cysteine ligase
MNQTLAGKTVLLIITGGIAAYKSLDLIRRLRERGARVRPIMTKGAQEFITPLSVGALAASKVHTDLFDREDEIDVGHIRLARDCDCVVVAPATADFMAKAATGQANDLATTCLLATHRPILMAPAMNPAMWDHPATQRNFSQLVADGVFMVGPEAGEMAESGEAGVGRMAEPLDIVARVESQFAGAVEQAALPAQELRGRKILVTAGPTHEPIDPVRYIANRSSGKQGYAIAEALASRGADVTLVSGPTVLETPPGVNRVNVETAREMLDVAQASLPADAAYFVAAVADWRVASESDDKIKKDKSPGAKLAPLELVENPDILATIGNSAMASRPKLVVGFAAETQNLTENATAKMRSKGADWIVANDVSVKADGTGVMGGDDNAVKLLKSSGVDEWPSMSKREVAEKLAEETIAFLGIET